MGFFIPCGKCLSCKIKRRTEWTLRMLHHADGKENTFATLTYNENWLPRRGTNQQGFLLKSDLQKFFKRLRAKLYRANKPDIEYYACGEYGDDERFTFRPHYHAIIFNLSFSEAEMIKESWPYGNSHVGMAEPDSIRYVAQYIDKKLIGIADAFNPETTAFQLASNGLGLDYLKENYHEWLYNAALKFKGKEFPIPRYYYEKMEKLWPDAAWGMSYRVKQDTLKHEADELLELNMKFDGRTWDQLTAAEQVLAAELMVEKNRAIDNDLRSNMNIKLRGIKSKKDRKRT